MHIVTPTIRHLFGGFGITIFAHGGIGTGKLNTMRGGKSLKDRGIIPQLLSGSKRCPRRSTSKFKQIPLNSGSSISAY